MHGCSGGACVVAPGEHVWLLRGACMVVQGDVCGCSGVGGMHGCSAGGMHGCSQGGVHGCSRGACMGYDEIRRYGQ